MCCACCGCCVSVQQQKCHPTHFGVVGLHSNGTISVREFLDLPAVLTLKYQRVKNPEPADSEVSAFRRYCRRLLRSMGFWVVTIAAVCGTIITALMWTLGMQEKFDACNRVSVGHAVHVRCAMCTRVVSEP